MPQKGASREKLGLQIAQLAKANKLKQVDIANTCDTTRAALNRFFQGHSELRLTDFMKVAKLLDIDVQKMIDERLAEANGIAVERSIGDEIDTILKGMSRPYRRIAINTLISQIESTDSTISTDSLNRLKRYSLSI